MKALGPKGKKAKKKDDLNIEKPNEDKSSYLVSSNVKNQPLEEDNKLFDSSCEVVTKKSKEHKHKNEKKHKHENEQKELKEVKESDIEYKNSEGIVLRESTVHKNNIVIKSLKQFFSFKSMNREFEEEAQITAIPSSSKTHKLIKSNFWSDRFSFDGLVDTSKLNDLVVDVIGDDLANIATAGGDFSFSTFDTTPT